MAVHDAIDILLMRHGTPAYPPGIYPDPFLMPLSEQGRAEASAAASAVERFSPDLIFSSDFLRASQTAELASAALNAEISLARELRERVCYCLIGKSFPEIVQEYGDGGTGIVGGNSDLLELPGEEGYAAARRRVVDFVRQLARSEPEARVLLVCHGGPHAWLIEEALGADLRGTRRVALRTGFFSRFTVGRHEVHIDSMNVPPAGVGI
jgi:broad specificity phosphatase PhoE